MQIIDLTCDEIDLTIEEIDLTPDDELEVERYEDEGIVVIPEMLWGMQGVTEEEDREMWDEILDIWEHPEMEEED